MKHLHPTYLYPLQTITLFGGSVFAWWTIYHDFARFISAGYTLGQFSDCSVPNPLATPCFYGGIAFVLATLWSSYIWIAQHTAWSERQQLRLWWLLLGGTLFAWSNFGYQVYKFAMNSFQPTVGCSATVVQTPFETPCFVGAVIYLTAFVVGSLIRRSYRARA